MVHPGLKSEEENGHEPECGLLDTGVFDGDRYFDVFVEYAKPAPDDILVQITACNRARSRRS